MKKLVFVLLLIPSVVSAQGIPVIDVQDLLAIIAVVRSMENSYRLIQEQRTTIETMRRGLPNLARFRVPGIPMSVHDLAKYPYARDVLGPLNGTVDDPYGDGWYRMTQPLQIPPGLLATLPPELQRIVRNQLAGVQLHDATAIMATSQIGQVRQYHQNLQTKIDALQNEVLQSPSEVTANLDKLAIAGTLRSRQQEANSQLQSSALEMMVAAERERREAEVQSANQSIGLLQNQGVLMKDAIAGASDVLGNWFK